MTVEYEHWLIARGNTFAPSAEAIAKLVAKLRAGNWIVDPASPSFAKLELRGPRAELARQSGAYAIKRVANTFPKGREGLLARIAASTESVPAALDANWLKDEARQDLNLVWPVSSPTPVVSYPLTRRPDGPVSYKLEIHRSVDFAYPIGETIEPLTCECRCGNDLTFEWDPDEWENPFGATTGIFTECDACSRTFDPTQVSASIGNPFDGSEASVRGGAAHRFALKVDCMSSVVEDPGLAFAPALVALVEEEFGRSFFQFGSVY
ncbi:MAG: hypothetical protein U0235_34520 [Polyangiaceae bacterium]